MEIRNRTPHAAAQVVELDRDGAERLVVVLKATWRIGEGGALEPLPEPVPPLPGDLFHGEPDASSLKHEAELGSPKPSTDVLLVGSAIARRSGTRAMDVQLEVGPVRKVVRVFGDRRWTRALGVRRVGDPEPFERMPLVWERAFGGIDDSPSSDRKQGSEPRNPVGMGFRAKGSKRPWLDEPLPNLETPDDLLGKPGDRPAPAGFAPICRHWLPRRDYAGTYDQHWIDERMPILPADFDERFHQAAPPDQIAPRPLVGGERVRLIGLTSEGTLELALPALRPALEVRLRTRVEHPPLQLDTVGIDTDARTLRMVWKGACRVHGELTGLRWVELAEGPAPGEGGSGG